MALFKCKMCGGNLNVKDGMTVCECEYCGTKQTLPKLDDEKRNNLYDRANHFRRNNEYDKAMSIYEKILDEDKTDAEAYWSLVLCKYGIEYVEDPTTHKRVPTVNRAQYTSVFADENYKQAIANADSYQKDIYESEAKTIDEIQKGILEISNKEEPFDVFICYKETGNDGRRTPDSVLATELYHELTREGFKVFFSRITLEDKLGTAYEPYIFAALNSSKVMVVLGTKPEYFNAVWVKNEWSRYLALIKEGKRKALIPAYKDMDPYDLPEEFSHFQAQDMSKLGFMSDLVHGIKKIALNSSKENILNSSVSTKFSSVDSLLKRVDLFLEDESWDSACEYCEKVLDIEPENGSAYIKKVMAKNHCSKESDLYKCGNQLVKDSDFEKAVKFTNEDKKQIYLSYPQQYYKDRINTEEKRLEKIYEENKFEENTVLSHIKNCQNELLPLKINYEKHIKNGKLAKLISFVTLAVIVAILNIISGKIADDVVSFNTGIIVFALWILLSINGIINCIVAPNKRKMLNVCNKGLIEVENYYKLNEINLEKIKKQKELIAANYILLSYFNDDVSENKFHVNIDEDIRYYSKLEKIIDFDFAIPIFEKEKLQFEKRKQRLMKRPETRNKIFMPVKKSVALIACVFGGWFGIHKFYEGKIWQGILYLFTFGLFGFGIVYDFFDIFAKDKEYFI